LRGSKSDERFFRDGEKVRVGASSNYRTNSNEKVEITGEDKPFNISVKSVFKRVKLSIHILKNPKQMDSPFLRSFLR
jgi:hypothetical protein